MNARIKDKIEEIEKYLKELKNIVPDNLEEYVADFKTKAACERYLERLVEAAEDLAFLVVKDFNLEPPEEEKEVFETLFRARVIDSALSQRLKRAKGMRNVLAHQYGQVEDKITFLAVTEEIGRDLREFIKCVRARKR